MVLRRVAARVMMAADLAHLWIIAYPLDPAYSAGSAA
jgi:hypothetical protein